MSVETITLGCRLNFAESETIARTAPPGEQFALDYVAPLKVKHYEDPIPGFEGPWLAALAPVGRTGFVVLVETRE